jgi:mannose-1-phosphate guanylyltransferase
VRGARRLARRHDLRGLTIRQALILTAGLGTRLRPLTNVRAKPAIPVAGEPMIVRIIKSLRDQGVTDYVLNLHHRPETLTAVVGDGSDLGVRVRYSWEQPRVLGGAGGPRHALPLLDEDPLLIVNGDTLTDIPVANLERAHATAHALVTLALVPNTEFLRYGGVQVASDRRVTGFVPRGPAAEGSCHYVGLQIAHRSVFESLTDGVPANTIGDIYDTLIATRPGSIAAFVTSSEFWDVGTVDDYWRMSDAFAERERRGDVIRGRAASIHPDARVTRSILWDDVEVGAGAVVDRCVLTDRVHVPAGAVCRHQVLIA